VSRQSAGGRCKGPAWQKAWAAHHERASAQQEVGAGADGHAPGGQAGNEDLPEVAVGVVKDVRVLRHVAKALRRQHLRFGAPLRSPLPLAASPPLAQAASPGRWRRTGRPSKRALRAGALQRCRVRPLTRTHARCMHAACASGGAPGRTRAMSGDTRRSGSVRTKKSASHTCAPSARHGRVTTVLTYTCSQPAVGRLPRVAAALARQPSTRCAQRGERAARLVAVKHGDHLARRDGRAARVHQAQRMVQVARLAVHLVCARARPQAHAGKPGMPPRLPGH